MEGVSVIICCYNSAKRLPETLSHLAEQKFSAPISWEVIVVDNASTDNTDQVAAGYITVIPLRIVSESNKGLSLARRRGIAEAKFDTLIFCDDDNWLDPVYVATAFDIMKDQSIGAVGGIGSPSFETTEPAWFKYVGRFYAVGEQKDNITARDNFRYLYGAGMVVSKKALTELFGKGFVNLTTDRVGNALISGGDTELSLALQKNGYQVHYSDKLQFQHFISKEKLTVSYCNRLIIGVGYSSQMIHKEPTSISRLIKAAFLLLLPLERYGKFFEKWRLFLFEIGRHKFVLSGRR